MKRSAVLICLGILAIVTQSDGSQPCTEPRRIHAWGIYVDRRQLSGCQGRGRWTTIESTALLYCSEPF